MTGNDGNLWEIKSTSTGTHRWSRISNESNPIKKSQKASRKTSRKTSRKADKSRSKTGEKTNLDGKVIKIMSDMIDGKVVLTKYDFYGDRRLKFKPDVERLLLQFIKKMGQKPVGVEIPEIESINELYQDQEKYDELKDQFGNEFFIDLAKNKDGIFLYAATAPGENTHGYALFYDYLTGSTKWIFNNWDGDIRTSYRPFKTITDKFTIWKRKCDDIF